MLAIDFASLSDRGRVRLNNEDAYGEFVPATTAEVEERGIVYHPKLLDLAAHYGVLPKACRPYRAKTKGKVERPYYIRQDFFLGARFADLEDLNAQLKGWLDTVANARQHGTTQRVVAEHRGGFGFSDTGLLISQPNI